MLCSSPATPVAIPVLSAGTLNVPLRRRLPIVRMVFVLLLMPGETKRALSATGETALDSGIGIIRSSDSLLGLACSALPLVLEERDLPRGLVGSTGGEVILARGCDGMVGKRRIPGTGSCERLPDDGLRPILADGGAGLPAGRSEGGAGDTDEVRPVASLSASGGGLSPWAVAPSRPLPDDCSGILSIGCSSIFSIVTKSR